MPIKEAPQWRSYVA